jgi:hypothetical protein
MLCAVMCACVCVCVCVAHPLLVCFSEDVVHAVVLGVVVGGVGGVALHGQTCTREVQRVGARARHEACGTQTKAREEHIKKSGLYMVQ